MKFFVPLFLSFAIAACSWLPPKYDNNQYLLLVSLYVGTQDVRNRCTNIDQASTMINVLHNKARVLQAYSSHLERNEEILKIASILLQDFKEFKSHITNTTVPLKTRQQYCKFKSKLLEIKIDRALTAVGGLQQVE